MKRVILLFMAIVPYYVFAQLSTCVFYDGYWGAWKEQWNDFTGVSYYNLFGNYSGFTVYSSAVHPSKYSFKFEIDSYTPPSQETIKYHYKNNIKYEYTGYVEYFVSSSYPTIKSALERWGFTYVENGTEGAYKRTAKATIKIFPYKKHPKGYMIYFEDVGIGLDLGKWSFNK